LDSSFYKVKSSLGNTPLSHSISIFSCTHWALLLTSYHEFELQVPLCYKFFFHERELLLQGHYGCKFEALLWYHIITNTRNFRRSRILLFVLISQASLFTFFFSMVLYVSSLVFSSNVTFKVTILWFPI
jgi:hypothetical protein